MNTNANTNFDIQQYLDSLPDDTEDITVCNRNLDYLPSLERFTNLKMLICSSNNLTSLPPLNEKLEQLCCSYNNLTSLPPLNKNLMNLLCHNNNLTSLPPLNEKLEYLHCGYNNLTSFPQLNEKMRVLGCDNNPISIIFNPHERFNEKKIKIETLNRVRDLWYCIRFNYYSLKFKKPFRDLLWLKIREPRIRKQFNPIHLKNLSEDADLDEFLNNW